MADGTALERASTVVHGDRSELRLEAGQVTIHKNATTQRQPTEVTFGIDRVRGATLEAPPRGGQGWLHIAVVGGSPPPPTGLAAAGDPYTLPLTSRGASGARKLMKMIERHVQAHGLPSEARAVRPSSGVVLKPTGELSPKNPMPPRGPAPAAPTRTAPSAASAREPDPVSAPASATADADGGSALVSLLRELADLHASGALSDDEFQRAKDRLLR